MVDKKLGSISFRPIPESIKIILKIKEDAWFCNFSKSFCQENKINPENLEFEIIKDSDKIMLVAHGTEQTELENHTQLKVEASNAK